MIIDLEAKAVAGIGVALGRGLIPEGVLLDQVADGRLQGGIIRIPVANDTLGLRIALGLRLKYAVQLEQLVELILGTFNPSFTLTVFWRDAKSPVVVVAIAGTARDKAIISATAMAPILWNIFFIC